MMNNSNSALHLADGSDPGGGQAPPITESVRTLGSALEHLQTNIFIADADRKLVFVNSKARETLRAVAAEVRDTFHVDVESLLGMSIDRFHSDPAKIAALMSDPRNFPRKDCLPLGICKTFPAK